MHLLYIYTYRYDMYIENPSAKHCTITDPGGHGAAQAACRQSVPWIDEVFRCFSGYWDVVYGYWLLFLVSLGTSLVFLLLDLVTLRMPGMLQLSWLRRNLHQEWRIFQGKIIDPNGTFSSKPCLSTGGYFDGSVLDWNRVESGTEHGWTKKNMVNLPRGLTPSNLWDILRSWSPERNDISIGISPVYQWHVTVVGSQMVAKCRPFFSSIKRIQKEIPTAQREPFEMNVHVGLIVLSKLLRPHCLTVLEEEFLFEKKYNFFSCRDLRSSTNTLMIAVLCSHGYTVYTLHIPPS